MLTFIPGLLIALTLGKGQTAALKAVADKANIFRVAFFVLDRD